MATPSIIILEVYKPDIPANVYQEQLNVNVLGSERQRTLGILS